MKNIPWHIVDVRDVVDALLLVYEKEKSARIEIHLRAKLHQCNISGEHAEKGSS